MASFAPTLFTSSLICKEKDIIIKVLVKSKAKILHCWWWGYENITEPKADVRRNTFLFFWSYDDKLSFGVIKLETSVT